MADECALARAARPLNSDDDGWLLVLIRGGRCDGVPPGPGVGGTVGIDGGDRGSWRF